MRKRDRDPSPKEIVQHIMISAAATKKHISRFMLIGFCYSEFACQEEKYGCFELTNGTCFGSRFILRILPVDIACYASEEEISKAIVPLVEQYFPAETENPQKVVFFSLYYFFTPLFNPTRPKLKDIPCLVKERHDFLFNRF